MLRSIQVLRALAAWAVVAHHVGQFNPGLAQDSRLIAFFSTYGALGVDLFFIISGFVIHVSTATKNVTPFEFLRRRIQRIVPPYWVLTGVVVLMLTLDKGVVPFTQFNVGFLVESLLFIPAYNPSGVGMFPLLTVGWTLNYEMMFYLVYGLSLFLAKPIRLPFVFTVIFSIWLFGHWLIASGSQNNFIFYGNEVILEFLLGVLLAIGYRRGWFNGIGMPVAAVLASLGFWLIGHFDASGAHAFVTAGLPFSLIVVALLSQDAFFARLRVMLHLGEISYSTYLCHIIVLSVGLFATKALGISVLILLPFMLAAVYFISRYSYRYLERWDTASRRRLSVDVA